MDFELRAKKIQKESELRLQEAKKKKERELKLQMEQKQREQKMLEIAEENRLKLLALEEERLEQERLLYQKTGGIKFCLDNLIPYEIEGEDDKVILPESSLAALDQQNALSSGPLCFEISARSSGIISNGPINGSGSSSSSSRGSGNYNGSMTTHCGVREFSATEGTIGLPPKVIRSLLKRAEGTIDDILSISILYTRLPKITNAKFAPVIAPDSESIFQVGPIKLVLEENLRSHSALSVGDHVSVWHRGKHYRLSVVELQPEPSGSLFNADVEVEFVSADQAASQVEPSVEGPGSASSASKVPSGSGGNSVGYRLSDSAPAASSSSSSSIPLLPSTNNGTISTENTLNGKTSISPKYEVSPEPDSTVSESEVVHMRVRVPVGASPLTRRFLKSQRLADLFYFVCQALNIDPSQVQVTLPSKNRTITWGEVGTQSQGVETTALSSSLSNNDVTFESVGLLKREMAIVSIVSN